MHTTLIVVDQFEEVFTLNSQEEREEFAEQLVALSESESGRYFVILTMRTDHFVDKMARLNRLYDRFCAATRIDVQAMGIKELESAILKPAQKIMLKFEDGIVDDMISKILGEGAGLPLLQFTLLQLWKHRERNRITWKAYKEVGDPLIALERSAERCYQHSIGENQTA